jgi:hypothetical protein
VALVRTDVSEERITSIAGLKRISELGTMKAVTIVRTDVSEELISSVIRVERISALGTT